MEGRQTAREAKVKEKDKQWRGDRHTTNPLVIQSAIFHGNMQISSFHSDRNVQHNLCVYHCMFIELLRCWPSKINKQRENER